MKRVIRLLIAGGFVAATLAATTGTASADAEVTTYQAYCEAFSANGTTDSPYFVVEVYDEDADEDVFFGSFPSSEGTFSFALPFATPPAAGTNLIYFVWGSPTDDPDDWDEGTYFELGPVACESGIPATTTTSTTAPTSSTTSTTAGPAVAEAAVVAPAFTG